MDAFFASVSLLRYPQLRGLPRLLAWGVCLLPVLLGFVLPVLILLRALWLDGQATDLSRFASWTWNSVRLGAVTALLAVGAALLLASAARLQGGLAVRVATLLVGLGYAVPGAVIVVGLLLPVGWLQQRLPDLPVAFWVTGTVLGVVWAYLVRFMSVALQSVQSGYARIPPAMDDSARILGTAGARLLARVHWPLLRRSALAGSMLVFVDVMKELPATLVLRPFNTDTLAVMAYQLARDERLGEAALPSLALVLVGLIPVALLSRSLRSES